MKSQIQLTESWNMIKGELKIKFKELTDQDLLLIEGRQSIMINRIKSKLCKTNQEVREIIHEIETDIRKQSIRKSFNENPNYEH